MTLFLHDALTGVSRIAETLEDALAVIEERREDGSAELGDEIVFSQAVKALETSLTCVRFVAENIRFIIFQEGLGKSTLRTQREGLLFVQRGVIGVCERWAKTRLIEGEDVQMSHSIAVEVLERLQQCSQVIDSVVFDLDSGHHD